MASSISRYTEEGDIANNAGSTAAVKEWAREIICHCNTLDKLRECEGMTMEIYERGRILRTKKDNSPIIVEHVEITTKGGKLDYKVFSTYGEVYDIKELRG